MDSQGVFDSDTDGIPDALENQIYGTNPLRSDSSGSGIPDGWLVRFGFDPLDPSIAAHPAARPPVEGLPAAYGRSWPAHFVPSLLDIYSYQRPSDWNESAQGPYDSGLDPTQWDANEDGLPDGWLLYYGLDAHDSAMGTTRLAGARGLTVRDAFQHASNPKVIDTDGDGLADVDEVAGPLNPTDTGPRRFPPTNPARRDTAGTGVCDGYLVAHGLDPTQAPLALGDPDHDGATTQQEFEWSRERFGTQVCSDGTGLIPIKMHSGNSTIPDGWLIHYGLNPLDPGIDPRVTQSSHTDPRPGAAAVDGPNKSLTVLEEYRVNRPSDWREVSSGPWWGGTNPSLNDTDGDGLGDAWELKGFNLRVATEPGRTEPTPYQTTSDPTRQDTDGDGLSDGEEADPTRRTPPGGGVTDPRRWDTDLDGLDDATEVGLGLGLDPAKADTAGDFLRDGERLDMLTRRVAAYAANTKYEFAGEPGKDRLVTEWAARLPGAAKLPKPLTGTDLAELFGPRGNVDGDEDKNRDADGLPLMNLLDRDIDGDGLLNGWEVHPELYADTEFGAGDYAGGRPATDPLHPDTDGDLLADGWEIRHGKPDSRPNVLRYNLDPAQWNSDDEAEPMGSKESDAAEDPDDDGVQWYSFEDGVAIPNGGAFTNLQEQQYEGLGANPNRFDSDGDLLADGWKIFWGLVYPGLGPQSTPNPGQIYPGAPGPVTLPSDRVRPLLGKPQSEETILMASYNRSAVTNDRLPGEQTTATYSIRDRVVYRVEGVKAFRFIDAQSARTNPYLIDTDGDGMPDWWEVLHAQLIPGLGIAGECVSGPGPVPIVADGALDLDGDGLSNLQEFQYGSDPLCADSDGGGIRDGSEVGFSLNPGFPLDDQTLLDEGKDTDGDGLLDFEEVAGIKYSYLGTLPVRTKYDNPDTDGDGLLDGATVPNPQSVPGGWPRSDLRVQRLLDLGISYYTVNGGFFFRGEKSFSLDPRQGDDTGMGVPAGWLVARGFLGTVSSQDEALYRIGIPAWWNQTLHGPWWGGGERRQDLANLQQQVDLDSDGLRDFDGQDGYEDPWPAANLPNQPRAVNYTAHGLVPPAGPLDASAPPVARRMSAQSFLSPRVEGVQAYSYPRNATPHETAVRIEPCIELDPRPGLTLFKGQGTDIAGTVTDCNGSPLANVTLEARLGLQVFGANFSGPDGRFNIRVDLVPDHAVQMPASALVFRGNTSGTVRWATNLGAVPPGNGFLTIRSYASPGSAFYASRLRPILSTLETMPIAIRSTTTLTMEHPSTALTGQTLPIALQLTDGAGSPLQGKVKVWWEGGEQRVNTSVTGAVEVLWTPTHTLAGIRTMYASYTPSAALAPFVESANVNGVLLLQRPGIIRLDAPGTADAGGQAIIQGRLTVPAGSPGNVALKAQIAYGAQVLASGVMTTNSEGRFAVALRLPQETAAATHVVTVLTVPGSPTVAGPEQDTLVVRSIPRFLGIQNTTLTVGQGAVVAGGLFEPGGNQPLVNARITIRLDGQTTETNTNPQGRFSVALNGTLPVGPVLQEIFFAGDAGHQPSMHRSQRFVSSATRLTLEDGEVGRGLQATLVARLVDATGKPLAQLPIALQWGQETAHTFLTSRNGEVSMVRAGASGEALGDVVVRATYAGNPSAGLAPSKAQATWTIRSAAELTLPNGAFEIGDEIPPGLLRDAATLAPLAHHRVTLKIGPTQWSVLTNERGQFPPLPTNTPPSGRILLTASFAGDGGYGPVSKSSTIDWRTPVHLDLHLPPALVAGREIVSSASVTNGELQPVGTGDVLLRVGGVPVGQWPLAAGASRINFTLPASFLVGPAEVVAEYLGDALHAPATSESSVIVLAPVQLHLQAERARTGGMTVIRVSALSAGHPLAFTQLSLAVGGTGSGLSATTDKNGVAIFRLEQGSAAVHVAARYAGNSQSGPAMTALLLEPMSSYSTLAKSGVPIAALLLAGAIALAVTAFVLTHLRRQPLEEAFRRVHHLLEGNTLTQRTIVAAYRVLEDAAIQKALLFGKATTPGALEESLRPALPTASHASLRRFIRLFEDARYSQTILGDAHRTAALAALQDILRCMPKLANPEKSKARGPT